MSPTSHFQNINNKPLNPEYIYQPINFVLNVEFNELVKVANTDPIDAIIGEKIGWQTNGNNSFYIGIWSELFYDTEGCKRQDTQTFLQINQLLLRKYKHYEG